MNPSSNPQPLMSNEQNQLIDRLLAAHKGLSSGQVEAITPVIQQYAKDYASELIGQPEQQPVEYFDEVEKRNVRKFPTPEMHDRNNLRTELHQLNNERAGKL